MEDELIQSHPLITPDHLRRLAVVYVRQSTEEQVRENTGSTDFQRSLATVARSYGWPDSHIEIIDEDLGRSGSSTERRTGWQRLQTMIAAKQVGAVFVATISRLSRQVLDFEIFRQLAATHNTLLYTDGRLVNPADSTDTIVSHITAMVAHFENRKRAEIMAQARRTKAKQGHVVSWLPVGWIKSPDGQYDYDPETKDTIRMIIDTFWQTRSLARTVKMLAKAGVQIPYRRGRRLYVTRPTLCAVRRLLTNPAYTGTYVFGKTQAQPGGMVLPNGQSKYVKVPEEQWIKTFNHHPPYMSVEQQQEIKSILEKNRFQRRDRPGRGPALTQGLLRCAKCKQSLAVRYHREKSYKYRCAWDVNQYNRCTQFANSEFDKYIVAEVFKALETPPLEMLKRALDERRNHERKRLAWIESERERLKHEERIAQERADLTRGSLHRVHLDALEKLERVLEEKERFEQKIALRPMAPENDATEEELEELCRVASEVPTLWQHPAVTNRERKEILRCVIDHIVVAATKERIDATIFWKTGESSSFYIWCGAGKYRLVRELHAQNPTVSEIQEHLANGKNSAKQVVNYSVPHLRIILNKLGLKPNRFSADYLSLRQKVAEFYREGRSLKWVAQYFSQQGIPTASGKPWTYKVVYQLYHGAGEKAESLNKLHRKLITEGRSRGLSHREIAMELNERKIRRRGDRPWTERSITERWHNLNQRQRKRTEKQSTDTEPSESIDLKKYA